MSLLKYKELCYSFVYNPDTEETEKIPGECLVTVPWSESAEARAKEKAINGEYTIEEDSSPASEPTTEEVLNALLGV